MERLGKDLLDRSLFKDALKCFIRAKDDRNAAFCEALIAEAKGEVLADSGKILESQKQYSKAAAIYEKIGEHVRATPAYMTSEKFLDVSGVSVFLHEYDKALDACYRRK